MPKILLITSPNDANDGEKNFSRISDAACDTEKETERGMNEPEKDRRGIRSQKVRSCGK
jgi:hypothetical protein